MNSGSSSSEPAPPTDRSFQPDDVSDEAVFFHIESLLNKKTREAAYVWLVEHRMQIPDLGAWLWFSDGIPLLLVTEVTTSYSFLHTKLTPELTSHLLRVLCLLQAVAGHPEAVAEVKAHNILMLLLPIITFKRQSTDVLSIQSTALGVFEAFVRAGQERAFYEYALQCLTPHGLRILGHPVNLSGESMEEVFEGMKQDMFLRHTVMRLLYRMTEHPEAIQYFTKHPRFSERVRDLSLNFEALVSNVQKWMNVLQKAKTSHEEQRVYYLSIQSILGFVYSFYLRIIEQDENPKASQIMQEVIPALLVEGTLLSRIPADFRVDGLGLKRQALLDLTKRSAMGNIS